jgi:hypothetical protein
MSKYRRISFSEFIQQNSDIQHLLSDEYLQLRYRWMNGEAEWKEVLQAYQKTPAWQEHYQNKESKNWIGLQKQATV